MLILLILEPIDVQLKSVVSMEQIGIIIILVFLLKMMTMIMSGLVHVGKWCIMMTNMQRFYRRSLEYIESAMNARACSEFMLGRYELHRKYILKCLLRWQLKEFDNS